MAESASTLELIDPVLGKKITFTLDHPFKTLYFKLKTLSQSEQGFDLTVQGVSFALEFPFCVSLLIRGTMEIADV